MRHAIGCDPGPSASPGEASSRRRRVVVVHNPLAGRRGRGFLEATLAALGRRGLEVSCRRTAAPGDAEGLARRAVEEGAEVVVAAGGDGTVHEVVNGLAASGYGAEGPALAVLPTGTANLLATELGLASLDAERMAETLATGPARSVDLGRANGRWFVACAGLGVDAAAVTRVSPLLKQMVGLGSYVAAGVAALLAEPVPAFRVELDGVEHRASALLVSNIRAYAGFGLAVPQARMDDGLLDLLITEGEGRAAWAAHGLRLFLGGMAPVLGVRHARARRLRIDAPRGLPVQLDGDVRTRTPVAIEVAPARLPLLGCPAPAYAPASSSRAISGGTPKRSGSPVDPTPALTYK